MNGVRSLRFALIPFGAGQGGKDVCGFVAPHITLPEINS